MDPDPAPREPTLGELSFGLPPAEAEARARTVLAEAEAEVGAIETAAGPRTVENTLRPVDRILHRIADVGDHGRLLFQAHPDADRRAAGRRIGEAVDQFFNAFRLRGELYRALREIGREGLDPGTRFALEKILREMRRSGVELDAPSRSRLKALNDEIDRLANEFMANVSTLVRTVEVTDPEELDGLPPDYRASHTPSDGGPIRLQTQYPDYFPVMAYATHAELRRRFQFEFMNRAFPQNLTVLDTILARRAELARLLGYPTFADFVIEDKMMGSTAAAWAFLDRVGTLLRGPAFRDFDRLLERKRRAEPGAAGIDPWDVSMTIGSGYYDTQLLRDAFGVDAKKLRAYLAYPRVRDGLFGLCEELFGITFRPAPDAEVWDPSVEAFDVRRDGRPLGRCYLDLVPREGKFGHAAQFTVRSGLGGVELPQAALICNFLDPKIPRADARMEYKDVVTFFHEFGHLLHALLSGHGPWFYNGQGFVELDFIEAPSQLFEEWARDPATLGRFARHAETGEPIPASLVDGIERAASFGRAYTWLGQVTLAAIALAYHDREPAGLDTTAVLDEMQHRFHPMRRAPGTHFQAAFGHLTGYTALYYTYLWSLVIARDLLRPFRERGSLTAPDLARRYADTILAPGSAKPAAELVRDFLGREFAFDSFERWVLADPLAAPHPP
ncbi:MAG TPA: M3 family metallopeptidase [Thermoplasmata archaeon]|nr:M3 family metallopeptidase [Thermoplasmata archaeon]